MKLDTNDLFKKCLLAQESYTEHKKGFYIIGNQTKDPVDENDMGEIDLRLLSYKDAVDFFENKELVDIKFSSMFGPSPVVQ